MRTLDTHTHIYIYLKLELGSEERGGSRSSLPSSSSILRSTVYQDIEPELGSKQRL